MLQKAHSTIYGVPVFLGDIVKFGRVNFKVSIINSSKIQARKNAKNEAPLASTQALNGMTSSNGVTQPTLANLTSTISMINATDVGLLDYINPASSSAFQDHDPKENKTLVSK